MARRSYYDPTEAREALWTLFKGRRSRKALTVYPVLRSVSRDGMSRTMDFYIVRDGEVRTITALVAGLLGLQLSTAYGPANNAAIVGGCGMDMGFHVVYTMSRVLYRDRTAGDPGYRLNCEWR
tara:strand:+ start:71 stop:439 length:369 start_codon:yes stop_codon:yes gene_type:complete